MNQAILTAKSGVLAQQTRLDVIGNNVANVNTTGYKSSRVDFKDALYQTLLRPVQPQDDLNLERGHGVLVSATGRDMSNGTLQQTNNMLDFKIEGNGFFTVQDPQGEQRYTRNGAFTVSIEEDGNYLVNGNGWYVLDTNSERIQIPALNGQLYSDQNGNLFIDEQAPFAQLGRVRFDNPNGLEAAGDSTFTVTEASGEPVTLVEGETTVIQGALEASNVDLANEMTRLIRTQRALQLSSRAISTADQMMGIANNIRQG